LLRFLRLLEPQNHQGKVEMRLQERWRELGKDEGIEILVASENRKADEVHKAAQSRRLNRKATERNVRIAGAYRYEDIKGVVRRTSQRAVLQLLFDIVNTPRNDV
jgi:hypothetical protein